MDTDSPAQRASSAPVQDPSGLAATGSGSQTSTPSITLPKGGGAIRGIGETFSVSAQTGNGGLTVPIFTSPGRSNSPALSLSYSPGNGNGPFGLGWMLSIPSVSRKTEKGLPRYDDDGEADTFILSDAEDLVPALAAQGNRWQPIPVPNGALNGQTYSITRYRPRVEGIFARVERWRRQSDGISHWRVVTKDNVTSLFGRDSNCVIADPRNPSRIFKWLLETTFDDKGNVVFYEYKPEDATGVDASAANERNRQNGTAPFTNLYIKRILYGTQTPYQPDEDLSKRTDWLFEAVFDYGEHNPATPAPAEDPARKWNTRADPFSTFRPAFDIRTYRLCQRVLMFHHFPKGKNGEAGYDGLVRSTDFTYGQADPSSPLLGNPVATKLISVTQTGFKWDSTGKSYISKSLPPLEFTFSEAVIDPAVRTVDPASLVNLPSGLDGTNYQWLDLDGEGISGILTWQTGGLYYKRNRSPVTQTNGPGQIAAAQTSASFGDAELLVSQPSASLAAAKPQFMELAGDGRQNMVQLESPVRGYYERSGIAAGDGSWDEFQAFRAFPNVKTTDRNLKFVDVDGDGLTDLLVSEDEVFAWYRSYGRQGFGSRQYARKPLDEERGAALVFAEGDESLFLADMTGDGLTDIVRVRNGEVCYWPNLGYARFGAKVAMDNAPYFDRDETFDPRRIRLADIDGCGTTDIIYLAARGVAIYHNQSGNSWSQETTLPSFPALNDVSTVNAVDLLGNGTSCLVWSSSLPGDAGRQMRYIDLMGSQKPHLLTGIDNNLGAETRIRYASSSKFYVEDREAGTPWVTKLPFPVQVAERVEIFDYIGRTRIVNTYRYRHGYFDGVEREFRGFGYVEQTDADSFGDSGSLFTEDTDTEADALHAPPVVTKTWFHTGAWPDEDTVLRYMARDYFGAPDPADPQFAQKWNEFLGSLLPDSLLPADVLQMSGVRVPYALLGGEQREALRALRGSILRQEVYASDGSAQARLPYSVSARNYTIECLQPRAGNPYAVFFTHARETIDSHYERNVTDPRVAHQVVLAADPFGNVLESASIAYGRNLTASGLPSAPPLAAGSAPDVTVDPSGFVQPEQLTALLTLEVNSYAPAIDTADAYRNPLKSEGKLYQLTTPARADDSALYKFSDLTTMANAAVEIPYETAPDPTKTQKRLLSDTRTLYYKNDLSGPAPAGQSESLGLVFQTYQLVFTANLAQQIFIAGNTNPNKPATADLNAILSGIGVTGAGGFSNSGGGYVNSQGDGNWWNPSVQAIYAPVPQNPPNPFVQSAASAAASFYLPQAHRDAFGQYLRLTYDSYNLLLAQTQDAVGNVVIAVNDYRVLQCAEAVDPNQNHSQVAFDALGLVAGTAVQGKVTAGVPESGDSLANLAADLAQADIDGFLNSANPLTLAPGLLGTATVRVVYDLTRFSTSQAAHPTDPTQWKPNFVATISRETHVAAVPVGQQSPVQVSFSYSDGLGREIQKKSQAEPGPLDLSDPNAPVVTPRWIGSGWKILNNKAKPVRQYEPFFSATQDFEFANKSGVTRTMFYDPLGRVIATLYPDATWGKSVFDAWLHKTWDSNDTVQFNPKTDPDAGQLFGLLPDADYLPTWYQLRTDPSDSAAAFPDAAVRALEAASASKAAAHNNTPSTALFDVLGRQFLSVDHNRANVSGVMTDQYYSTRTALDVQGNQLSVTDPLGRQVMVSDHDQTKQKIHSRGMDAGERWTLGNVAGKQIRMWDSRGFLVATSYDELQRPIGLNVTGNGLSGILAEQAIYGDSKQGGPASPELTNSRGKVYQGFDASGLVTNLGVHPVTNQNEAFDYQGNLIRSRRRLLADYKNPVDWTQNPALGTETFTIATRFDALKRVIQQIAPYSDSPGTKLNIAQPRYNEANLLQAVDIWLQQAAEPGAVLASAGASFHSVTNIDYDGKGQRTLIDYGNGVSTTYRYDPKTFRLTHSVTTRPSDGVALQDLAYYFDPTGNLTHLQDNADIQNAVYFANKRVEPSADYTYDAIYRLISATGREHLGLTGNIPNAPTPESYNDWLNINLPHPNNGNAMGTYTENYAYDAAGNPLAMQHVGSMPANPGWTRSYNYAEASPNEPARFNNRLTGTTIGAAAESYTYDAHGNTLRMPHLQVMQWDFKNQLQMTQRQAVNNQDQDGSAHKGERTYYVYDSSGQRVLKATESSTGALVKQRIYLGSFELYREYGSAAAVTLERQTLHVLDDKRRIALVEMRTQGQDGTPAQLIRLQFSNHLDSACLELDDQAQVITYEEYYPYGSTSYQAVTQTIVPAAKRYRYTGKERDEETGLSYHGTRYYAPWLGRWTAADPTGLSDGVNLYVYVRDNPVMLIDRTGNNGDKPDKPLPDRFSPTEKKMLDNIAAAQKELAELKAKDIPIQVAQSQLVQQRDALGPEKGESPTVKEQRAQLQKQIDANKGTLDLLYKREQAQQDVIDDANLVLEGIKVARKADEEGVRLEVQGQNLFVYNQPGGGKKAFFSNDASLTFVAKNLNLIPPTVKLGEAGELSFFHEPAGQITESLHVKDPGDTSTVQLHQQLAAQVDAFNFTFKRGGKDFIELKATGVVQYDATARTGQVQVAPGIQWHATESLSAVGQVQWPWDLSTGKGAPPSVGVGLSKSF